MTEDSLTENPEFRSPDARAVHPAVAQASVRHATRDDVAHIEQLLREGRLFPGPSASATAADIAILLDGRTAGALLARGEGGAHGLLGYAVDGGTLRLFDLSVCPGASAPVRDALITALVRAAEPVARSLGLTVVAMQAIREGMAIDALVAAGFAVDCEEYEPIGGNGPFAVADLIKVL